MRGGRIMPGRVENAHRRGNAQVPAGHPIAHPTRSTGPLAGLQRVPLRTPETGDKTRLRRTMDWPRAWASGGGGVVFVVLVAVYVYNRCQGDQEKKGVFPDADQIGR